LTLSEDNNSARLRNIYENTNASSSDREHAFYGYWRDRMQSSQPFSRDDLTEILDKQDWKYAVNDIIAKLVLHSLIRHDDIPWLRTAMVDRGMESQYGIKQLDALIVFNDPAKTAIEKLETALELRADWIALQVITDAAADNLNALESLIAASSRPRHSRHNLLSTIRQRRKDERPDRKS
jgi:hypothetical protein